MVRQRQLRAAPTSSDSFFLVSRNGPKLFAACMLFGALFHIFGLGLNILLVWSFGVPELEKNSSGSA